MSTKIYQNEPSSVTPRVQLFERIIPHMSVCMFIFLFVCPCVCMFTLIVIYMGSMEFLPFSPPSLKYFRLRGFGLWDNFIIGYILA